MNTFTNNSSRKDVTDLENTPKKDVQLTEVLHFCYLVQGYAVRDASYRAALRHAFGHPLRIQRTDAWIAFYRAFDQVKLPKKAEEDAYFVAGLICSQNFPSDNHLGTQITYVTRNLSDTDISSAIHRLRELLPVHHHAILHKKLFGLIRYLQSKENVTIHSGYLLYDLLRWNDPSHSVQREWLHRIIGPIAYKHLPVEGTKATSDNVDH